jgi:SAM-dependent methyltransferase
MNPYSLFLNNKFINLTDILFLMKKLNMGCGLDIKEGYINLDLRDDINVDVIHNLNKFPYPFKDNEFDEILCKNVLEHLENTREVLKELKRIIKKDGVIILEVPYYKNKGAFRDPTHRRFFTEDMFPEYFNRDFDILQNELVCTGKFRKLIPFKRVFNYFLWGVYDILRIRLRLRTVFEKMNCPVHKNVEMKEVAKTLKMNYFYCGLCKHIYTSKIKTSK